MGRSRVDGEFLFSAKTSILNGYEFYKVSDGYIWRHVLLDYIDAPHDFNLQGFAEGGKKFRTLEAAIIHARGEIRYMETRLSKELDTLLDERIAYGNIPDHLTEGE